MSWGILCVAPPSAIAAKMTAALAGAGPQPRHADTFDHMVRAVAHAVGGISDSHTYAGAGSYTVHRQVLVESTGHIDGHNANITLSVRMITEYEPHAV